MIYLIDFKTCYKIGRTNNLTQRLKTFKNSREDLELISLIAFPDKIVLQEVYDQNGETYLGAEASKLTGTCYRSIIKVLNGERKSANNFIWSKRLLSEEELLLKINELRNKHGTKIIQMDLNDNFIAEYKSLTEASKQTGISCISNNIAGRTKRAGNFHWKYN